MGDIQVCSRHTIPPPPLNLTTKFPTFRIHSQALYPLTSTEIVRRTVIHVRPHRRLRTAMPRLLALGLALLLLAAAAGAQSKRHGAKSKRKTAHAARLHAAAGAQA